MLANAINLPLVALAGLVVLGPLTLLVSLVEWLVFRCLLAVRTGGVFRRILGANVLSTFAGVFVWACQNSVLNASGIDAALLTFARGFWWVAGILILLYLAKSLLVEGLFMATRAFSQRVARSRLQILRAVLLGNLASYCITGPLFYIATRPTFGHLKLLDNTRWTSNAEVPVYFIDGDDQFIKRIKVDGTGLATVVPFAAAAFLVSEDQSTFAYRGTDGYLYVYRAGAAGPDLVWQTGSRFHMDGVSIAPDNTRVAFAADRIGGAGLESSGHELRVFDLISGEAHTVADCVLFLFDPIVSWSRSGEFVFGGRGNEGVVVVRGEPPYVVVGHKSFEALTPSEFPLNFVRSATGWWSSRDDWGPDMNEDSKDSDRIRCWPGLGAHCVVKRNDERILFVADGSGLLKLGMRAPHSPTFLSAGSEVLFEWWGQLWLLDIDQRRLGMLTSGKNYVMPIERFRVRR